jgi:hypothetical protein
MLYSPLRADLRGLFAMSLWADFLGNKQRLIHKWAHYFPVYESYFERFRNRSIVFLEIGCGAGGSLQMWKHYFGPLVRVVGIDIRPQCKVYEEDQIAVRIGDQSDPAFLQAVADEFQDFDIVLDDGSHINRHMRASFMDFRWLIMADEATDKDVLAELSAAPNASVLRVNGESGNDAARSAIGRNVGQLITVRLDSDDQVSCKFTALVRSEAAHVITAKHKECAIYFVNGMQFDTSSGKYFHKTQYTNMFPALYESRWPIPRTANFRAHTALPQIVRCVLVCNDEPMWCNIIHGGNVLNVIDGTPMDGEPDANW